MTQEELAKRAGIPRPNLSAMESGKGRPSLETLRMLAGALGVAPGLLADGFPPINFKKYAFTRESLENIVRASLGEIRLTSNSNEKKVSALLSKIIRNRLNAKNKNYKNILQSRQAYIVSWLMLKAATEGQILNNLLARLDKHIEYRGLHK